MECEDIKPETEEQSSNGVVQDFPPGMAPKMLNLVKALNDLEKDLKSLTSQPYHEVLNKLSALERGKIGMMEVYTINSLFWVLMKVSGEDTDSSLRDDWKVEMGRLKETQGRLAEVEARLNRPPRDTQAATRIIKHTLGINDNNNRKKKKRGGNDS